MWFQTKRGKTESIIVSKTVRRIIRFNNEDPSVITHSIEYHHKQAEWPDAGDYHFVERARMSDFGWADEPAVPAVFTCTMDDGSIVVIPFRNLKSITYSVIKD